jgi:hypothetical protein
VPSYGTIPELPHVAKLFCPFERVRLIQDWALMGNFDSKIHSPRFDCCVFLSYNFFAATFATNLPIPVISRCHSITSSAVASSDGGTVRPSVLAALRLITNSNLIGYWTGSSAGLVPRKMRSTYDAARR